MKATMAAIFLSVLLMPVGADAVPIVDTGAPAPSSGFWSLHEEQWLAAEFTTLEPWSVTTIEGFFGASEPGTLTIALYADGGDMPGAQLFSQDVVVSDTLIGWRGLTGVNWLIPAGSYWAAFEVRGASTFEGGMFFPSAAPLLNEAIGGTSFGYSDLDDLDVAVRILADAPTAIPEPTSLLLLATGVGLIARRKRL